MITVHFKMADLTSRVIIFFKNNYFYPLQCKSYSACQTCNTTANNYCTKGTRHLLEFLRKLLRTTWLMQLTLISTNLKCVEMQWQTTLYIYADVIPEIAEY